MRCNFGYNVDHGRYGEFQDYALTAMGRQVFVLFVSRCGDRGNEDCWHNWSRSRSREEININRRLVLECVSE